MSRVALLVLVLAACKDASGPLYTQAELAAYRAATLARLDANAKRTCTAPEVTTVEPGALTEPLYELVEPPAGSPLRACYDDIKAAANQLGSETPAAVASLEPPFDAIAARCSPELASRVRAIASRTTGCSPWQKGVHPMPQFIATMQALKLLAVHVRQTAEPDHAARVLIEILRVAQDLGRGHAPLIDRMIGVAITDGVATQLHVLLVSGVPSETYDMLSSRLDRPVAETPPFTTLFDAERDYRDMTMGLGQLDPTWTPPGGWGEEKADIPKPAAEGSTHSTADQAGLMFELSAIMDADAKRACPPTARVLACCTALAAPPAQIPTTIPAMRRVLLQPLRDLGSAANWGDYATRLARTQLHLAWLRVHVEVLRAGHCKGPIELVAPMVGEVIIAQPEGAEMVVQLPDWLVSKAKPDKRWAFACPAPASK